MHSRLIKKFTVLKRLFSIQRPTCTDVAALANASWPTAYIGF